MPSPLKKLDCLQDQTLNETQTPVRKVPEKVAFLSKERENESRNQKAKIPNDHSVNASPKKPIDQISSKENELNGKKTKKPATSLSDLVNNLSRSPGKRETKIPLKYR